MATKLWLGNNSGNVGDASVAANWSPSGVPGNSDDVVFDGAISVQSVTAGLDQSAYTYPSLTIYDSYTGTIGTATAAYQCGATICTIHKPSGVANASGSTRINLDLGSVQTTCRIHGSAIRGADTGMPPIRLVGTHASNGIYITGKAIVGIAAGDDSESATVQTTVITPDEKGRSPDVTFGVGCTLTYIRMSAGTCINRGSNVNTVALQGGTYTVYGSATHTLVEVHGGKINYNSSGLLNTLTIGNNGSADFSGDGRSKTVATTTMQAGGNLNINNGNLESITFTNGIDLLNCAVHEVTIETWRDINMALDTI